MSHRHWLSFSGIGGGSFSAAMVIAVASIAGWDGGIYVNEETKRPEKNPELGAVIAVAILGVIFTLMFAAFQGIAPLKDLQDHSSNAAAFVGHRLGGGSGERVMSLAVVLSVLATTQVAIIGTSRLIYSRAGDPRRNRRRRRRRRLARRRRQGLQIPIFKIKAEAATTAATTHIGAG